MAGEPRKVHTPEVLFPDEPGPRAARTSRQGPDRWERLAAGLLIDAADLLLMGPLGLRLGLPVGLVLGLVVGRLLRLGAGQRLGLAALTGLYCALPGTSLLPLATLVALLWPGWRR